jgi:preprotein translocase subunit YajC
MNWLTTTLIAIPAAILIAFLIYRNQKDEKVFEEEMKDDYTKPRNEEGDIDVDELTKDVR